MPTGRRRRRPRDDAYALANATGCDDVASGSLAPVRAVLGLVVALAAAGLAGCGPPRPATSTPCTVEDGVAVQAVREPPPEIRFVVARGDGGARVCTPGLQDDCGAVLRSECVVDVAAVVGAEVVVEIGVANLSPTDELTIATVAVDDEAFAVDAWPATIAPDRTEVVRVTYRPTIPGEDQGLLTVASNAVNARTAAPRSPSSGRRPKRRREEAARGDAVDAAPRASAPPSVCAARVRRRARAGRRRAGDDVTAP